MYGTDDQDDVTVRFGPDPAAKTEALTQPVAEAMTEAMTKAMSQPLTEAMSQPASEAMTQPVSESMSQDHTILLGARDNSAGYTVPGAPPAGLPRRVPAQFAPPVSTPTGPMESRSLDASGSSIRIGKGVTAAITSKRSRGGESASRRWWGRFVRVLSGLITVALIGYALWTGWLWWQRLHDRVGVETVAAAPAQLFAGQCNVQFDIVGTITTNGKAGTISYEWLRSDGQRTGTLKQSVSAGQTSTTVHLYWKFTGQGSMTATATLHVIDPVQKVGVAEFRYSCA